MVKQYLKPEIKVHDQDKENKKFFVASGCNPTIVNGVENQGSGTQNTENLHFERW